MKAKKLMAMGLAAALSLSLLGGCSNSTPGGDATNTPAPTGSQSGGETTGETIKVAALESAYGAEMWQKVADAFTDETGIEVELVVDRNLEDVIGPAMQGGEFPDFIHLSAGREDALTEAFIRDQNIEEVTDVLSMTVPGEDVTVGDKIMDGFTDSTVTNPYSDGKTYFAPMFYSPCGLFYNAGLFEEKGWEVPTTWDEM